jgi:hypothetical protein
MPSTKAVLRLFASNYGHDAGCEQDRLCACKQAPDLDELAIKWKQRTNDHIQGSASAKT